MGLVLWWIVLLVFVAMFSPGLAVVLLAASLAVVMYIVLAFLLMYVVQLMGF